MNRSLRTKLLLGSGIAVVGGALWLFLPREPTYNGHALSYWLSQLDDGQTPLIWGLSEPAAATREQRQAAEAVRKVGARALPNLIDMLQATDSVWERLHPALARFRLAESAPTDSAAPATRASQIRHRAALGLIALGLAVQPQVPRLAGIFEDFRFSPEAALVLASIGPTGLPPLQRAITNSPGSWQAIAAITALGHFPTNAHAVLPQIFECVTNSNGACKSVCVWAICRIETEPEKAVNMLTNSLHDPQLRGLCLGELSHYGARAKAAIPLLLYLLNDTNFNWDVAQTLEAIDPELAAKVTSRRAKP